MLVAALALAVMPIGRQRLGTGKPEYTRLSWLAMLFAAGMGSGLVFWGVAEPLTHLNSGPVAEDPGSALALTYFHWGLHAWAIYAMGGLVIAYFAFCRAQPMSIAAPLSAALQSMPAPVTAAVGALATSLAMLAVIFGVAGTLANGVIALRTGLLAVGLGDGSVQRVEFGLLALISLAFLASARSGIGRSIRRLSVFNLVLATLLIIMIVFSQSAVELLRLLASSTWEYLTELPRWSSQLIALDGNTEWAQGWTVTYLIWWIAWTPFVGLFIARISRGRTIREYLLAVVLVPTLVSIIWFLVFGGGAMLFDQQHTGELLAALRRDYTQPLFLWLGQQPLGPVLKIAAVVLLFVFLITSADSAAYVLGMLSEEGNPNPSNSAKLGWGIVTVVISAALITRNDVDINKAVAIVGAIPFTVILWLQVGALLVTLWRDSREKTQ